MAARDGRLIIHPFDDPYVIAGQGTIGMEILRQFPRTLGTPPLSAVFVCVGGGGMIAGISAYFKAICPHVQIIGVEAEDADAMLRSLHAGQRVELKEVGLFADGAAVRLPGAECFRLCQQHVDAMITVSNDEICAAIKDTFQDTRSILEPAGALSLAGAKRWINTHSLTGESLVCVTSGANMNFNRLRFVAERAELGENKEALLAVTIPETPGSFMKLYEVLYPRNVTEFSYRYHHLAPHASVYLSFETDGKDPNEVPTLLRNLSQNGMSAEDVSDNELAKTHLRFLVGGRPGGAGSEGLLHERIYSFVFPERPGALHRFLKHLMAGNPPWNCTLFHYRNFGSDFGKVLAGIQVLPEREDEFQTFLKHLHFEYREETHNPVYSKFMR